MLRIVDTIIELIADVAPLAEEIGRRDPALAKQLRDALSSVALNVAEGSDQRGARRTNHYSCGFRKLCALFSGNSATPSRLVIVSA